MSDPLVRLRQELRDPAIVFATVATGVLGLAIPLSMIQVYDRIIPKQGYETLAALGLIVLSAILFEAALRVLRFQLMSRAGGRFEGAAYRRVIDSILNEEPSQSQRHKYGELTAKITSIDRLRDVYSGPRRATLLDLPMALLFMAVLFAVSPEILWLLLGLLAVAIFVMRWQRRTVLKRHLERQELEERRQSFLTEVLGGYDSVRTGLLGQLMTRRYERLIKTSVGLTHGLTRSVHTAKGIATTVGTAAPPLVACLGAYLHINEDLTLGTMAAAVLLTGRIVQPVLQAESFVAGIETARMARDEFRFLHDVPRLKSGEAALEEVTSVELRGVSTSPDALTGLAFSDLSLKVERGECVHVSGSPGLAPSSFLSLLACEIPLKDGEYLLNYESVGSFDIAARRKRIRLLSANNRLLDGTLMQNLTNFQPSLYADVALELSARLGLHDFIAASPVGYDMRVGPSAPTILPRGFVDAAWMVAALVTRPDVILFDAPNVALDRETDDALLALIAEFVPEAIVFLVSERPSYLRLATRELDLTPFVTVTDRKASFA